MTFIAIAFTFIAFALPATLTLNAFIGIIFEVEVLILVRSVVAVGAVLVVELFGDFVGGLDGRRRVREEERG